MKHNHHPSVRYHLALGGVLAAGIAAFPSAIHAQTPTVIYACVSADGGPKGDDGRPVRIVSATQECKPHEIRISWNTTGPQGPAGPMGPVGPIGPAGPAGPQGAVGPQGPAGATGPQGAKGDKGDKGDVGATGATGPQGTQGLTGPTGPQGAVGPAGPQGAKGDTGSTGLQGPQGPTGPQGPAGSILVGAQNFTPAPNSSPFLVSNQTFQTLAGSGFPGVTQGYPLLIQVAVPLYSNLGNVACQPAVDGKWAGSYAFPTVNAADPLKDMFFAISGYVTWSSVRVYSNIPAGNHWFSIQCWAAGQVSFQSSNALISMSVIEMH